MSWNIPDLSDYLFAGARNGGPIGKSALPSCNPEVAEMVDSTALIRDERKVMLLGKHSPGKPKIHIYTSSGILVNSLTVRIFPPSALYQLIELSGIFHLPF